jgi:isocitrate lyase
MYLKKGVNPETGRKFGLEHSAKRTSETVKAGLASHVWMETPDANVAEARQFMDLVNEHLAPHGLFARGLYNHSPSFVWDVSFFIESTGLAKQLVDFIATKIAPHMKHGNKGDITLERARWMVKNFLRDEGDRVRGDYNFSDGYCSQLLGNGLDAANGEVNWRAQVDQQMTLIESIGPSLQSYKSQKELDRIVSNGYKPLRHITNIIVAQRLKNFKDKLSDAGFEVHLCTLPLYPSDAHTANKLARGMTETGIHDFVINQRAARKYEDNTGKLTCFNHQKATGTGWEVTINKIVGTSNTDILTGSTEAADQAKEDALKADKTGPSSWVP